MVAGVGGRVPAVRSSPFSVVAGAGVPSFALVTRGRAAGGLVGECWVAWVQTLVTSGRVVISCAGRLWSELIPLCLASFVGHPVGVWVAVSSAGRFWPARLLSSRLGGGELSGATGMGSGAGRSRGLIGRVPEEQPSAAGLGLAAPKYSSAGRLVVRSVGIGG